MDLMGIFKKRRANQSGAIYWLCVVVAFVFSCGTIVGLVLFILNNQAEPTATTERLGQIYLLGFLGAGVLSAAIGALALFNSRTMIGGLKGSEQRADGLYFNGQKVIGGKNVDNK